MAPSSDTREVRIPQSADPAPSSDPLEPEPRIAPPTPPVPGGAGATVRWKLVVAYDGAGFHGFAEQPHVPTVAGALRAALERATRAPEPLALVCAGRTDAGVHARGQVLHVDLPAVLPVRRARGEPRPGGPEDLVRSLNRQLAPEIVVREAAPVGSSFDARRDALSRRYRYLVWNAPFPDPLVHPWSWHVAEPLDLRAMAGAADALMGTHDFRAFCRRPPGVLAGTPLNRTVLGCRWSLAEPGLADAPGGRLLRFDIEAQSFCHQMVRSVVAVLVAAGRGKENAATITARLHAAERRGAPDPAPARGLCLVAVTYPVGP